MSSHGVMFRAAALTGALVGLVSLFFMVVRPWYMGWGATAAERVRTLPGDALVLDAPEQETCAITVQVSAEKVWPWVAQLGQDRGGFYSYELLEDLVGCEMENLHYLDPALQQWQVGDKLWMYPRTSSAASAMRRWPCSTPGACWSLPRARSALR